MRPRDFFQPFHKVHPFKNMNDGSNGNKQNTEATADDLGHLHKQTQRFPENAKPILRENFARRRYHLNHLPIKRLAELELSTKLLPFSLLSS